LVVTAVLARVDGGGRRMLGRKLPQRIRADLDDSKRLVAHGDVRLGEAWARVLAPAPAAESPATLLEQILLEGQEVLSRPCPKQAHSQCWSSAGERFEADAELSERIAGHRRTLAERGIELLSVKSKVLCTKRLNEEKERGVNRFVADLHAMESLVLALRKVAGKNVHATLGKVGGMGDYSRFFGPLGGHLHAVIEQRAARSAYYFPNVGELHFVKDADASDPLVMLASLVGKYVRELLMARVARFYPQPENAAPPSGYHDPVSRAFVHSTALVRSQRRIPSDCFERARDPAETPARSQA
jgi:ribonuclease HII